MASILQKWLHTGLAEQIATPPHEEPVLLSSEIEEQTKKLDREVKYLLNKLKTHPPPKPKTPLNTTNGTNTTTTSGGSDDTAGEVC